MSPGSRYRLQSLIRRKFQHFVTTPRIESPQREFKAMKLDVARYDEDWDKKRGEAVRLTGIVLSQDSTQLHEEVCADEKAIDTYSGAAGWLKREAKYLRSIADLQETAASRLSTILEQCRRQHAPTESAPVEAMQT